MECPQKNKYYFIQQSTYGHISRQIVIQKDTCTPMFIAALFTIAKTWKPPKCPSAEEWIKKMQYIYTVEYYSAIKNEIIPFARNMDGPRGYYSKCSQTENNKYYMISFFCGI